MPTARTLVEAQLHLSLTVAADDGPPDALEPTGPGTTRTEGAEAWTLSYGDGPGRIEVAVPYASEDVARRFGARFGVGVSQLVDAGQWVLVAATYARQALDLQLTYDLNSADERRRVELNWEFAADALAEAIKFLPEEADEVPPAGFWSTAGRQARADEPDLFTRARLLDDLEYYQGTLADFRGLHDPSA